MIYDSVYNDTIFIRTVFFRGIWDLTLHSIEK